MKKLNKWQNAVFLIGACLMVAGTGMYVFDVSGAACWIFAAGAVAFSAMQSMQTYTGNSIVVRRLWRIMLVADMFFVISALLMIENANRYVFPYFVRQGIDGYNAYIQYIHNNWVVTLLIAAILELYSIHRLSNELDKA